MIALLVILTLCPTLPAEVTATLPLQGHYRVGRYMPVRITVTADKPGNAARSIELTGDGVLSTTIPAVGGFTQATLPVLALQSHLKQLQCIEADGQTHSLPLPLHELSADERLVAVLDVEPAGASRLFPARHAVTIPLDMTTFTSASMVAWTSLDAVILSPDGLGRLSLDQQNLLLAGGVMLAVPARVGDSPPDKRSLWQYQDRFWIMRPAMSGPRSAAFNADAYTPTYSWMAQWPTSFRLRILLVMTAMSLIILLVALWRRRLATPLILITLVAAISLLAWWRTRHTPLLAINGTVRTISPAAAQEDHWSYQAAPDATAGGFAFTDLTYPIFASRSHAGMLDMTLACNAAGRPSLLEYHLPRSARIAILSRSFNSSPAPAATSPSLVPAAPSGLRELVRALYLRPGHTLAGQFAPQPSSISWPTLVIEAQSGK